MFRRFVRIGVTTALSGLMVYLDLVFLKLHESYRRFRRPPTKLSNTRFPISSVEQ